MNIPSRYLLIVEDDNDIRELLNTALTYAGYRVRVASNGKEGLEAVHRERPAIVITDIMMPQLDGFGLVHRLRINPDTRDIPVVFITATYVTDEDQEFALNIGATRFLQKPVDLELFLGTVSEVLKQNLPVEFQPLEEVDFYKGYRRRLEAKLEEKNKQITREEYLLGTPSDENNLSMQTSIHHAIREREEIQHLLDQLLKQIEKFEKPE